MKNSRWSHWSKGSEYKRSWDDFIAEAGSVDMGNPTSGPISPAAKASQMGLVSDGHGGYSDPNTGETVARTVNGELVFYQSGAGGGAVSDGAGGAQVAMAQPAWIDPDTGLVIVPPAKPESPEEEESVPDPTPATPPKNFHTFINAKKQEVKAEKAKEILDAEIEQQLDALAQSLEQQ
jgi:hypothetical protein